MKTVFMFPGQGAQSVGMGKDLADNIPEIAELYKKANEIVGYDLAKLCFEGPEDELNTTVISQPAIFVTSAACLQAMRMKAVAADVADITPDACAGLSLGEYTALYAAGAMSFEDALTLVQLRGKSMQEAAEGRKGSMVSILGMDEPTVTDFCNSILAENPVEEDGLAPILVPVNFNCPGQIVISGSIKACELAAEKAEAAGASRAIPLKVAGAFHTEMMAPAAAKLEQALNGCSISTPDTKVVANVDATVYDNGDEITPKLLQQLVSAVRWQQSVEFLLDQGATDFVEIGPGRVLTGLVKKIARGKKIKSKHTNIGGMA